MAWSLNELLIRPDAGPLSSQLRSAVLHRLLFPRLCCDTINKLILECHETGFSSRLVCFAECSVLLIEFQHPIRAEGNMSESPYIITGIKAGTGPDGAVPVRQEIDAWSSKAENQRQVNLFLLALRRYQDIPPCERDSFFQVAGELSLSLLSFDGPCGTDD